MKILQVNCVYKKGSTGKIVADIHSELQKKGIESVVCYGRGTKINESNVYKTCPEWYSKFNNLLSRFTGLMYGGCFFSTLYLIHIIKREKPDVVHLHCINGYFVNIYRLINWLKINKIKTVLTLHAEFLYTANCGCALDCEKWKTGCGKCPRLKRETRSIFLDRTNTSWMKLKNAYDGFNTLTIVAISQWIKQKASLSPFFKDLDVYQVYNGLNLGVFEKRSNQLEIDDIKRKYGIPTNGKNIILITSGNPYIKGVDLFFNLASSLPKDYTCILIGIYSGNIPSRIMHIPFISNQYELSLLYSLAKVLVITSRADNYPTVCLEANCCGIPVVGFDVCGVKETIGKNLGEVVVPFEIELLKDAVIKWSSKDISLTDVSLRRSFNSFERMTNDYVDLYKNIINKNQK